MNMSRKLLVVLSLAIVATGCKKMLDADLPRNYYLPAEVFSSDSLLKDAIWQLKKKIMNSFSFFNGRSSRLGGLAADELKNSITVNEDAPFLKNDIDPANPSIQSVWQDNYKDIHVLNQLIIGLSGNSKISPDLRTLILGEAYFLRALYYFYFINFFGDVPLVTGTEYTVNAKIPRTPSAQVYEQIIYDLKEAQKHLPPAYTPVEGYPGARANASKLAATALLARVYLFTQQWTQAEAAATEIINSPLYQLETDINKVFLAGSSETIFEFVSFNPRYNTGAAGMFVPASPTARPPVIFTDTFLGKMEAGDRRRQWIRSVTSAGTLYHSPYKYKVLGGAPYTEHNIVLRLAEQYLIRAEARAQQGSTVEAQGDLSVIRTRAGLPVSQLQLLDAIIHERRIEFFAEWGSRWLDLIRLPSQTNPLDSNRRLADDILEILKPNTWVATAKRWPIPAYELAQNSYLIQNPGY